MALSNPLPTGATAQLAQNAVHHNGLAYAGDITPQQSFDFLSANQAVLVDVRTPEEWQGGVPDLKNTQGSLVKISWKTSPHYELNPHFAQQLAAEKNIGKDTPLLFMCRGGGRSLDAALAMTAAGYRHCFNISGGYEGKPGSPGWKTLSLPSKQG